MENVINYLQGILKDNDAIVVACSSGPDSMCLLDVILNLNISLKIICAHVNHKVREESDEEYEYLKNYCLQNNIVFEGMEINEKINNNFEERARKIRYKFFNDLREKYNAKYILTAHHGDDLIETVLMRISRGSNLSGYAGIKLIDNYYLRPFLFIDKNTILKYLKDNDIKYFNDKTNDEDEHLRNRYRHKVVKFLKSEDNQVHLKYLKFSNKLQEYDNFINNYIIEKDFIHNHSLNIDSILKEDKLIIKKCIELIINDIQKNDILDINDKNIEDIIKMLTSKKSNSSIDLNNDYIALKEYDKFVIKKKKSINSFCKKFNGYYENNNFVIKKVSDIDINDNNVIRLNSIEIKLPIIIRTRINGDVMNVKNLGSKKIKDIFIDSKISSINRNEWPIVTDSDNNLLWLPGIKKSKFAKDKNEKYDIILLCERKDNHEKCKEE